LLLALSPSPVRGRLVPLEDRLLQERCLHGHDMGALQLEEQEVREKLAAVKSL
jgi:hypothetical protein